MELKLLTMADNPGYVDRSGGISCDGTCRLEVPAGKYRIKVIEADGRQSERVINIREPEKFWVGPIDDSARTTGLVLGVAGSVMVPVGLVMLVRALDQANDFNNDGDAGQTATFGFLIFLTGGVLAPVGWVMFGKSGKFTLERAPLTDNSASKRPSLNLGIAALPGGGGLGASFNF